MLLRFFATTLVVGATCAGLCAQTPLLYDNFNQEGALNTSLWTVNPSLWSNFATVTWVDVGTPVTVVTPTLAFSSKGMTVSGVNGKGETTAVISNQAFTPPFVVQATAKGITANGNPFGMYLTNASGSNYLRMTANLNPANTGYYSFSTLDGNGNNGLLDATPAVNIWYTMTVALDASGNATINLSDPSGATIKQITGLNAGTDPLYVALTQDEFYPLTVGPNESIWQEVGVFSGTGGGTAVNAGGIVNAASYGSSVAPGSIASVFGTFLTPAASKTIDVIPLPSNLFSVALEFNDSAAPLFFMSGGQANVQIPWEATGQVTVTPSFNGQAGTAQTVSISPFAPGIYTVNASGSGAGAILNSSYQLVSTSNPVTAGTGFIQIYCTGLGAVTNQPADGAVSPGSPLAETMTQPVVTIGGVSVPIYFSGLAPGFVGLYQVNAGLPSGIPTGDAVPVILSIGGAASNTVTIAVQ